MDMVRRLPLFATLLVLLAVGIMLRLGFWQLDRMHQKAALLARYEQAQNLSAEAIWPVTAAAAEAVLYRRSSLDCRSAGGATAVAGQNARGVAGIAHQTRCQLAGGNSARVVLGWSRDPALRVWSGGRVAGTIAPGPRLVADPPLAGLQPSARPDPSTIPNNHFSYAVQWFLFAAVALVIYALAVRKRLAGDVPPR